MVAWPAIWIDVPEMLACCAARFQSTIGGRLMASGLSSHRCLLLPQRTATASVKSKFQFSPFLPMFWAAAVLNATNAFLPCSLFVACLDADAGRVINCAVHNTRRPWCDGLAGLESVRRRAGKVRKCVNPGQVGLSERDDAARTAISNLKTRSNFRPHVITVNTGIMIVRFFQLPPRPNHATKAN